MMLRIHLSLRYLFCCFAILLCITSCAQGDSAHIQPVTETFSLPVGDRLVVVKKSTYDTARNYVFVHLHDNEATAKATATAFLEQEGGVLISIENNSQRNLTFSLHGKYHTFDPNRIFTRAGAAASLQLFNTYSVGAAAEIKKLSDFILQLLPDSSVVIALHNNTENNYSILSYQKDSVYGKDAAALNLNSEMDTDNFFVTTDEIIYQKLTNLKYNVILQANAIAMDDGSLSIYAGRNNIRYVNVEAQFDHNDVQLKMLHDLIAVISK